MTPGRSHGAGRRTRALLDVVLRLRVGDEVQGPFPAFQVRPGGFQVQPHGCSGHRAAGWLKHSQAHRQPKERIVLPLAIAGTGYGIIGILVIILLIILIFYFLRRA